VALVVLVVLVVLVPPEGVFPSEMALVLLLPYWYLALVSFVRLLLLV
jgi:hypothetical protein